MLLTAIVLGLLAHIPATQSSVTTPAELSALEGRPITAPCHYNPTLAGHVKYWCRGHFKDLCTVLARTDTPGTDPRVSIVDHAEQHLFTVTMKDLKEDESGWYHCGVEQGGMWIADASAAVYIHVIHGMSVVNREVTGEEGQSVTVECLYSKRYRDGVKRWCRSGDKVSCLSTGPDGRYDGPSVTVADDRVGAFAVTIRDLRTTDAGWYWCGVAEQQTAVRVLVTPRPSTTAARPVTSAPVPALSPERGAAEHDAAEARLAHRHVLEVVVVCASFMLIVGMVILAGKMWTHHQKEGRLRREALNARLTVSPEDRDEASIIFLNNMHSPKVDIFGKK